MSKTNSFNLNKLFKKISDYLKIGHELDGEDDNSVTVNSKKSQKSQKGAGCGYKHQQIGGACTLCGAEGVTKATCPLNPEAKNKKYADHNVGGKTVKSIKSVKSVKTVKSVKKSPTRKIPKRTVVARGCTPQTDAKYINRPSPPYPANECCGQIMRGNDGNMYISRPDKNNVCRWYKQK